MDDLIRYNLPSMAEYTHQLSTFSQRLQHILDATRHDLGQLESAFTTVHASPAYEQAQQAVNEGIQAGLETIARHGEAVNTAGEDFNAADLTCAQQFG